jgi:hypothetical protein
LESYGAKFQEKSIVIDGNIISNIGPAVGDEDALGLLEILIGKEDVDKITDMMMYYTVEPKELKWTFPVGRKRSMEAKKGKKKNAKRTKIEY